MLYIRITPGEYYSSDIDLYEPKRTFRQAMPVPIEYRELKYLRKAMSPTAWSVYCVLRYYEHIKFEKKTPTLEEIYVEWFDPEVSKEAFFMCIDELKNMIVKDEAMDLVEPILRFETEADLYE